MRLWLGLAATLAVTVAIPPELATAQFSPRGRKRPRPKARTQQSPKAATPRVPAAGPAKGALIARYTAVVLKQPSAPFPVERLAQLYRQRDGTLDKLIEAFEQRAADGQRAARVALGSIYRLAGKPDLAVRAFKAAIASKPEDPSARAALARLYEDRGEFEAALDQYAKALTRFRSDADIEQTLRSLLKLSLDLKRWNDAEGYHDRLVKQAQGSFFVRAELGRELTLRGEHTRAVAAYEKALGGASGDHRILAPLLRDYGRALAKSGQSELALKQLRRALKFAGPATGVRREVYEIIADVYRANHRLAELIEELAAQPATDPQGLVLLGGLCEETGQLDRALEVYRRALARNGRDIDTRLKVVKLLQISGRLEQAVEQYRALVRAAPHNPEYVFRLAESLIQRGERQQALAHLQRLDAQNRKSDDVLAALVDFYERVDEKQRALTLLQRLAARGSRDPRHIVELGSRFWRDGDKQKAVRTWKRLEVVIPDRAKAHHALGDVYLEHDMAHEALEALESAHRLRPKEVRYARSLALALERMAVSAKSRQQRHRYRTQALKIWGELLSGTPSRPQQAQEARQHIVTLWSLGRELTRRVGNLKARLNARQPDLEAGRLLAEVQIKLRRYAAAAETLRRIAKHAPGDTTSLLRWEQTVARQHKLRAALGVLERLVKADPQRARDYYQRMSQHAAALYEDDLAIRYA